MSVAGEDDSLDPSEEDKQLYGRALSFVADKHDARVLTARLNADSEIAFIVPDGPRPSLLTSSSWISSIGLATSLANPRPFRS